MSGAGMQTAELLDQLERDEVTWLLARESDAAAPPPSPQSARALAQLEALLSALPDVAMPPGWQAALVAAVVASGPPTTRSRVDPRGEAKVLELWRAGARERALRTLVELYGSQVLTFARRMLGDGDLALDVRQRTFLDAWQSLDRFEARSSLLTWLFAIARNRCLDQRKSADRRRVHELVVGDEELAQAEMQAAVPQHEVADHRALERCLARMSPRTREQVLMRCYLGMSYAEISAIAGEAAGTIQVRINRALPKLRRCLRSGEGS
jgi:RNA polymerase sigma-70 factor, ECF subfamily